MNHEFTPDPARPRATECLICGNSRSAHTQAATPPKVGLLPVYEYETECLGAHSSLAAGRLLKDMRAKGWSCISITSSHGSQGYVMFFDRLVEVGQAAAHPTQPTKNIGGGLLCSHNHQTCDLIQVGEYKLQVWPSEQEDIYFAKCQRPGFDRWSILSGHPNGHSCKELINRIAKGDDQRTLEQFDYILDCGGLGKKREDFVELLDTINKSKAKP